MLRAAWARSCQCLGSSRIELGTVVDASFNSRSGTIPPGLAFHKLDRAHAYAERMPTARRRMPETRERDHADLCEDGVARTCRRVPQDCRRTGTPPPLKPCRSTAHAP